MIGTCAFGWREIGFVVGPSREGILPETFGGGVALGGVVVGRSLDHRVEREGCLGEVSADLCFAASWWVESRQKVKCEYSESENIGSRGDLACFCELLGGEIVGGSCGAGVGFGVCMRKGDSDPKVHQFDLALWGQHDVCGFEVAVDDFLFVDIVEGVYKGFEDGERFLEREGWDLASLFVEFFGECRAVDPFHRIEEDIALAVFFDIVATDDAGVLKRVKDADLVEKAFFDLGILCEVWVDQLERTMALGELIVGSENTAHTTLSKQFFEAITPTFKGFSDRWNGEASPCVEIVKGGWRLCGRGLCGWGRLYIGRGGGRLGRGRLYTGRDGDLGRDRLCIGRDGCLGRDRRLG